MAHETAIALVVLFALVALAVGISMLVFARSIVARLAGVSVYRDFVNRRLSNEELPRRTRAHFERQTPDVERLGYVLVGDYLLQEWPMRAIARFLLSRDGQAICAIQDWKTTFRTIRTYSFTTVFDNGLLMDSARMRQPSDGGPEEADRLIFNCVPRASVAVLEATHRAAVDEYAAAHRCHPITFSADQVLDVTTYGHRLVYHTLHRKGYCGKLPPRADFPGMKPRESETQAQEVGAA
jgi:hypothetical protein